MQVFVISRFLYYSLEKITFHVKAATVLIWLTGLTAHLCLNDFVSKSAPSCDFIILGNVWYKTGIRSKVRYLNCFSSSWLKVLAFSAQWYPESSDLDLNRREIVAFLVNKFTAMYKALTVVSLLHVSRLTLHVFKDTDFVFMWQIEQWPTSGWPLEIMN